MRHHLYIKSVNLISLATAFPTLAVCYREGHWLVLAPDDDPRMPAVRCVAVASEPYTHTPITIANATDVAAVLAAMSRQVGEAARRRAHGSITTRSNTSVEIAENRS